MSSFCKNCKKVLPPNAVSQLCDACDPHAVAQRDAIKAEKLRLYNSYSRFKVRLKLFTDFKRYIRFYESFGWRLAETTKEMHRVGGKTVLGDSTRILHFERPNDFPNVAELDKLQRKAVEFRGHTKDLHKVNIMTGIFLVFWAPLPFFCLPLWLIIIRSLLNLIINKRNKPYDIEIAKIQEQAALLLPPKAGPTLKEKLLEHIFSLLRW
jgi:hypothetical protein